MAGPPRQFVLLHHRPAAGEHWDLCLEVGEVLATWQLEHDPRQSPRQSACRLADHRRDYLDYEGPLSRNRGHVTRVDRGSYLLCDHRDDCWVFSLAGATLMGTYELKLIDPAGSGWMLRALAD